VRVVLFRDRHAAQHAGPTVSRPQAKVSDKEADFICAALVHLLTDLRTWQRDERRRPIDHEVQT